MGALEGIRDRFRRWLNPPVEVGLVCEIAADYVSALRHQHGRVLSWATEPLPAGVVRPQPVGENISRINAVQEALQRLLEPMANGQRRCALIVPDLLARIAILEFDRLPARAEETEELLRWRLKKDLPFDIRQGILSYQIQAGQDSKQEVMVAVCLRSLVRQYEECLENAGFQPGWVALSTLAALGCLEGDRSSPRLLAKRDSASLSLAIVHGAAVRLFRSLPTARRGGEQSDRAPFEKIYPALVYFADQWKQPVREVVLAGAGGTQVALAQQVREETGCAVGEVSLSSVELPSSLIPNTQPDHRLFPSLGWARGELV